MKYDVTYTCGHVATIQLYGKTSERESRIKYLEGNCVCPECYKAQKDAERKAENEKAAETRGMQELSGSPKQVAWANTIREKAMQYIDKTMNLEDERVKNLIQYINTNADTKSASWWIDRRDHGELEVLREIAKAMMTK